MEHKYELENVTLDEVITLDVLFDLKDKINELYPDSRLPLYVCKVRYLKGYNIPYIILDDEDYAQFFHNAWLLGKNPAKDYEFNIYNFKATANDEEYALIRDGVVYTVNPETKECFAMYYARSSTPLMEWNTLTDVKTKEQVAVAEMSRAESKEKAKKFIEKTKVLINDANIMLHEDKIFTHIKYQTEDDYITAHFIYRDIVPGLSAPLNELPISKEDAYLERRTYYHLQFRERTGKITLITDIKRPDSDGENYLEYMKHYAESIMEFTKVASILKKLSEKYDIRFAAKQYN